MTIFVLYRCCPDHRSNARQIVPCDAQIPVDGFLAFFGLAGFADPMSLPATGASGTDRLLSISLGGEDSELAG